MSADAEIRLDRIEIEDAGPNPAKLAAAIHGQLEQEHGAVPVHAIAGALDIQEIRAEPLDNIEGALISPIERGYGSILVNASSSPRRQRFTVAHELGHFLNPWHLPTEDGGFRCSRDDIQNGKWDYRHASNRHQRQEAEANRFTIELLLPGSRFGACLSSTPDLDDVLSVSNTCDVSREATARRYVELNDANIAIAFSRNGRLRYWAKANGFPKTAIGKDDPLPEVPSSGANLTDLEAVDPHDWLTTPDQTKTAVQTLRQRDGYAMSLVVVEANPDKADGDIEDTWSRFSGFGS